jgi:hypothetical protein
MAFYFGNRFEAVSRIERLAGTKRRDGQIHQYSLNVRQMQGLAYTCKNRWEVDINNPPNDLEREIADAIRQIAVPFWNRYPTMQSARDALVSGDSWCVRAFGPLWHDLLYLDAALGELDHFEDWLDGQDVLYRSQAAEHLQRVRTALGHAI